MKKKYKEYLDWILWTLWGIAIFIGIRAILIGIR